ncbi:MAG: hypothetical protein M1381_09235 [Deltaproteobacteria bacterium]|nr:hypothetical protein [Deltaproteobacteria bacterium]MCL5792018.1 hypothetical protein [Deltaproteobacteria bacterium]
MQHQTTVATYGNLYVAVYNTNNYIDKITPAGVISIYSSSGNGRRAVKYNNPLDVAFNATGKLYVANSGNNILVVPAGGGKPSVFATVGSAPDAVYFANAGQSWPLYVTVGGDGTVYAIANNGTATLFSSSFTNPTAVATDAYGNVYVGDCNSGSVYIINSAGTTITTVTSNLSCPANMKLDAYGNIYILDAGTNTMYKYVPGTCKTVFISGTGITNANGGFTFNDTSSTLYVSQDSPTNAVTAISLK